jgi:hypothetical protein
LPSRYWKDSYDDKKDKIVRWGPYFVEQHWLTVSVWRAKAAIFHSLSSVSGFSQCIAYHILVVGGPDLSFGGGSGRLGWA